MFLVINLESIPPPFTYAQGPLKWKLSQSLKKIGHFLEL